jgi:type I restriction-modification system DNA methylase subunit
MPLFQQSVQKKFIKDLDKAKVEVAYQKLIAHFGNIDVQENIRKAKEEQYQEGFLRELFVDVLGYVLNPQPNYNLITEQKNEKNSKKADGAILKNGKPIAVIELKSVKTTDLQSIEIQAFNYKNNQTECVYVVTSNFQKLRFYIENAVDFEEFDLFELSKERFELLYLCLQVDNVLSDLPLRIKQASLEREENITKKLYADYSLFKQTLFKDIYAQNRDLDKLTLFKKTQKLLDRFLFIFFAEDKGLLPPNSVSEILNQWDKLKELDAYQPLYNRFKLYFGYLNNGHKGKHYDIFAYNGGLFAPDELLDNLTITDGVLYQHCRILAHYDFDTEVDTNILGHIFEHSLNEVDEIAANTEGSSLDKGKTKRKKDGIFYTPRYITKYIVESTVGELCKQKKISLGLDNEALIKADTKKDRKLYQAKIDEYRKWLLQLTILDPACGSGAFLNQAFEFLLQEHRLIDSMIAMLFGDSLVMTDNVSEILENNIYGVDINEESVEIARLSLWLRTAKVGRKLNDLSRNIKCGNSLISDPSVAGDLAFDWEAAFPQVFEKGGFDVVIGNPPYVPTEYIDEKDKVYLEKKYNSAFGRINLYPIFYERGINLIRENGFLGYITPYTILKNQYYKEARKYIIDNSKIVELIDFKGITVFEQAAVDSIIFIITKQIDINYNFKQISNIKSFENKAYQEDYYNISEIKENDDLSLLISSNDKLIKRIIKNSVPLKSIVNFNQGIITGGNSKYLTTEKSDLTEKILTGGDFNRYSIKHTNQLIIYDISSLHRPRKRAIFEVDEKILLRQTAAYPICMLDNQQYYTLDTVHNGLLINDDYSLKFLLMLLNSKFLKFLYQSQINEEGKVFAQVKIIYIDTLPIPKIHKPEQLPFIELAEKMLTYNADFQKQTTRFIKLLQSSFSKLNVNKKIETWYDMTFGEFRKELEKQKIAIPIKELMDYQELFDTNATQIKEIQTKINNTEKAIDKMVYALYELTDEEIKIIENQ